MTEDVRKQAANFVRFLQSLSQSEIDKGNEAEFRRAKTQHEEFRSYFHQGKCFLCKEELTTFKPERPCAHWLLRPAGFTKWHFMDVARRYGYWQIQGFLRWVANEEAFAKNINDLSEEGTGKLIELTIKYKTFEWSFSCAESDYLGHATGVEESQRPHYHFQMRVNKQAFIKFNNFHAPFARQDLLQIEAQRLAPETVQPRFSTAPGMSELLHDDIIEQVVMSGTSEGSEKDAPLELNTIIVADEGTMISGDDLANLIEEAKRKRVPVTSLVRNLPNVRVQTIVSPGPGVVEQTPRGGRGKRK